MFGSIWLVLAGCGVSLHPIDSGVDTDLVDTDIDGDTDTDTETDTDTAPPPTTIADIQRGDVPIGDKVTITGAVVLGAHPYGLWVADPEGGQYSGIYVYLGLEGSRWKLADVARGDVVDVTGKVVEYDDDGNGGGTLTELSVSWSDAGQGFTITGRGAEPTPAKVSPSDLSATAAEPWEGVLVRLEGGVVTATDLGFGEWELSGVRIDDEMVDFGTVYEGDAFDAVVGVLHFAFGSYKLEPRSTADFVGYDSAIVKVDALAPGDLVITEIMIDPNDTDCDPENEGEYLEIYNASGADVDLAGLSIADAAPVTTVLDRPTVIPAGGFALGIGAPEANFCYPSLASAVDFTYSAVWNNGGDKVVLANAGGPLDTVDFLTWSPPRGASMRLSDNKRDVTSNDAVASWCASPATALVDGGPDLGTPGTANGDCP